MGYFRRYKKSRYNLSQVTSIVDMMRRMIKSRAAEITNEQLEQMLFDWACYRELQARLEGNNGKEYEC